MVEVKIVHPMELAQLARLKEEAIHQAIERQLQQIPRHLIADAKKRRPRTRPLKPTSGNGVYVVMDEEEHDPR